MSFTTAKEVHYSEQTPPIGNTSVTHEVYKIYQNNPFSACNLASVCKMSKNLIGQMTSSSTSMDLMGGGIEL